MKRIPILKLAVIFAASLLLLNCSTESQTENRKDIDLSGFDASQSDAEAIELAQQVIAAAGGQNEIDSVRYLSFRFIVEAPDGNVVDWLHHWDRAANRYRLEGYRKADEYVIVYFNLNTRKGLAYRNGAMATKDETRELLGMAYSRFINDSYWLLLPFKLMDPGAKLEYEGQQQVEDKNFETIKLSFIQPVGLTPQNIYRVFINPESHLIQRWEYIQNEGASPRGSWWENWNEFGNLKLATTRKIENSDRRIVFKDIVVSKNVNKKIFDPPAKANAG